MQLLIPQAPPLQLWLEFLMATLLKLWANSISLYYSILNPVPLKMQILTTFTNLNYQKKVQAIKIRKDKIKQI